MQLLLNHNSSNPLPLPLPLPLPTPLLFSAQVESSGLERKLLATTAQLEAQRAEAATALGQSATLRSQQQRSAEQLAQSRDAALVLQFRLDVAVQSAEVLCAERDELARRAGVDKSLLAPFIPPP